MTQLKEKIRTVTFLTRGQIDFLDKLGKDALFYNGHKLSRALILSELVELLMDSGINLRKIDLTQQDLAKGILELINIQYAKKNEDGQISSI